MLHKNTLSFRIVTRVLGITALLFVLTISGYYYYTRQLIRQAARENAIQLAGNIAGKVAQQLQPMEKIPQMVSASLEMGFFQPDSLKSITKKILQENPAIFGAGVAFEPNILPGRGRFFMPFAFREGDKIQTASLGGLDYEYFLMDWYQIPALTGQAYWSEPYFDEGGGNALMITYAVPFYLPNDTGRQLGGIATVDVNLEWLTNIVSEVKIFESGYAFVLSRNGMALTHPDKAMIMNESIFSNAENWNEPLLREIGRDLQQGNSQFRAYNLKDRGQRWIFYQPLPSGNLSLAVVYPDAEMFAPLKRVNTLLVFLILIGLLVMIIGVHNMVSRTAKPLVHIAQSAREIASGNFQTPLPDIRSKDELLQLRNAFEYMQQQLEVYIARITETTAAKEKIESELRIAREIQMSMIPHSFPPFPDLPQIDLYAVLESAKEVGGDLYDFFLLGEDKFCFAIGDVSGKGVPASLFMAVTRTLLRSIADKYPRPAAIMSELNKSLSLNNDSCMFVTFFLGILDLKTGELAYSNAGHNPPLIITHSGTVAFFPKATAIPLGLMEDFVYPETILTMQDGDKIFAYTDGVSEAENAKQELFGENAIISLVQKSTAGDPRQLIQTVKRALEEHVEDYEQSDDITMLSVLYDRRSK